ncbi:penicillin-binding protein 2 [Kineothrix alysoides]|uniref:Penicillin-binding protein 2 n=1 Tax=Kineothrix alysoides TaxID=1469948 RepID=A0A4R1QZW8_9FIRM|nr:penicillin-binding protein 2 [Kineothrix alysoides]
MFSRFQHLKENLLNAVNIRLLILSSLFIALGALMIYRVFDLQIVKGENYLNDFRLKTTKTRTLASTRGNIYDRNGNYLAYNELAYNVTIEDVYESGKTKNANLNDTIYRLIQMIEKNGDSVVNDFNIILDNDGNYAFTVEDRQLMRFLADIYGYTTIDEMMEKGYKHATKTAAEVVDDLCKTDRFGIGTYADPDDSKSFVPGMGYTKEEILKLLTIRYALSTNSFQKYIATTVAYNVSEETVAVVMENTGELDGVDVAEDTVRKYVDSVYFSQIIGYTGKVSQEELNVLQEQNSKYDLNDTVGKSGIEYSMEAQLQGTKGSEDVVVDNMGKVIETSNRLEPIAGNDLFLTIDKDLQETIYDILESKLASILLTKIRNIKEYKPGENSSSSDILIPIDDVYFALLNNNIIDMNNFSGKGAGENEKAVYESFLVKKEVVMNTLRQELTETKTPYENLSLEYQVYESFITSMLNSNSVIMESEIDKSDSTYKAWVTDEVISLNEYLNYVISKNWVDVTKLDLGSQYSNSDEIYAQLLEYIFKNIDNNSGFNKKIYKYMIRNNDISGRQICSILLEQKLVEVGEEELERFNSGHLSPYDFMLNRIGNLDITPAQLALDPHSASSVVTDVNTGEVLALVSYPGYDNNRMANGVDADYFSSLLNDLSTPMINYATYQKTAPGSTFKMVTATAGLMEGVINTSSTIVCTGTFDKIDPPPHCWIWPRGSHGALTVSGGIRNSCNSFFYEVGYRLGTLGDRYVPDIGLQKLTQYADLYGLTETSGVEIEESQPQVSDEDAVRSAIGQGTNNYTTVGLARYVTTVANSGTCYNLTLLDKLTDHNKNTLEDYSAEVRNTIDMDASYWDSIHSGMRAVVEAKSYYSGLGVNVAGKTGTAQESKSRPNHALFVCYAPYENPEIAIATRVANGYTSDYAAQIAKDVIQYYYDLVDEEDITGTAEALTGGSINTD